MRLIKKILLAFILCCAAAGSFYIFYARPRYAVPVLMYHSIASEPESTLSVSPENFQKQMEYLNKAGFKVIPLDSLVQTMSQGRRPARKEVVLTFDDGFENNFTKAFPVLSKYGMPATVFLETARIGNNAGYLNWDQVRVMAMNNIDIGAHTRTGIYLPSVKDDLKLTEEIALSKLDIENRLGNEVKYFCYPTGAFNDKIKEIVRASGYRGACATNRGFDRYNDSYGIKRIKVTDSDMTKPFHFQAKLSGYYNLFRKGKSPD
ncbi:MAG: polysaccharide deacetylase family protein [Candidatus Omnitrophica bacterium]|nr:polysaccharide deacetylase family protein [Candidatus Omnitrophota bacterium]